MPERVECQAPWRTEEDYMSNAYANLSKNITPKKMAEQSKKYDSIKAVPLLPITSPFHIVTPGLHYILMTGEATVKYLYKQADILDGEGTEEELVTMIDEVFAEEDEERVVDKDAAAEPVEEAATGAGEAAGGDVEDWQQESRDIKALAEGELAEAELARLHQEQELMKLIQKLNEQKALLFRIVTSKKDDWVGMDELAKAECKNTTVRSRFGWCGDLCLLTYYDTRVKMQQCEGCGVNTHKLCNLWEKEEEEAEGEGETEADSQAEVESEAVVREEKLCLKCRPLPWTSYAELEAIVIPKIQELEDQIALSSIKVEEAKVEEAKKRDAVVKCVGYHRGLLMQLLEEKLKVTKAAYQGGTYVGNHVNTILTNHVELSQVLDKLPEKKKLFNEFCSVYLKVHHLIKAVRWLTAEELVTLESGCRMIGELWPKLFFGSSIPPKIDGLVFAVPEVAKRWGTIGAIAEDKIEVLHKVYNRHERVLATIRDKGKTYEIAMRREKVAKEAKAIVGDIGKPGKRVWSDPEAREKKFPTKK